MRILFSTVKDIGHVTPLVPYARGLRDLGHEVRVATSTDEGAIAALKKAGLAHAPFDGPAPDQLQAVMKRVWQSSPIMPTRSRRRSVLSLPVSPFARAHTKSRQNWPSCTR